MIKSKYFTTFIVHLLKFKIFRTFLIHFNISVVRRQYQSTQTTFRKHSASRKTSLAGRLKGNLIAFSQWHIFCLSAYFGTGCGLSHLLL